jgi:hypothetical protein
VVVTSPPYATQREYDASSGFKPVRPDEYVEWFGAVAAGVESILAPDGSYFLNIKEHADEGERDLYVMDLVIAHRRQWGPFFDDSEILVITCHIKLQFSEANLPYLAYSMLPAANNFFRPDTLWASFCWRFAAFCPLLSATQTRGA